MAQNSGQVPERSSGIVVRVKKILLSRIPDPTIEDPFLLFFIGMALVLISRVVFQLQHGYREFSKTSPPEILPSLPGFVVQLVEVALWLLGLLLWVAGWIHVLQASAVELFGDKRKRRRIAAQQNQEI